MDSPTPNTPIQTSPTEEITPIEKVSTGQLLDTEDFLRVAINKKLAQEIINGLEKCGLLKVCSYKYKGVYDDVVAKFFKHAEFENGVISSHIDGVAVHVDQTDIRELFGFSDEDLCFEEYNFDHDEFWHIIRKTEKFDEFPKFSGDRNLLKWEFENVIEILDKCVFCWLGDYQKLTVKSVAALHAIYFGVKLDWSKALFERLCAFVKTSGNVGYGFLVSEILSRKGIKMGKSMPITDNEYVFRNEGKRRKNFLAETAQEGSPSGVKRLKTPTNENANKATSTQIPVDLASSLGQQELVSNLFNEHSNEEVLKAVEELKEAKNNTDHTVLTNCRNLMDKFTGLESKIDGIKPVFMEELNAFMIQLMAILEKERIALREMLQTHQNEFNKQIKRQCGMHLHLMNQLERLRNTMNANSESHKAQVQALKEDLDNSHRLNASMADTLQEVLKVLKEIKSQQKNDSSILQEIRSQQKRDKTACTQGEGVLPTFLTFTNPSGNVFSTFVPPRTTSQPVGPSLTDQEREEKIVDLFADHFRVTHDAILDKDGRNVRECAKWYIREVFPEKDIHNAGNCYMDGRVMKMYYHADCKDNFKKLRKRINEQLGI